MELFMENNKFEIKAILSMNLKKESNHILGVEHRMKKAIDFCMGYVLVFCTVLLGLSKLESFYSGSVVGNISLYYYLLVEIVFIFALDFTYIVNADFLGSDYKDMMIFPIHAKNLFFAKVLHILIFHFVTSLAMFGMMSTSFAYIHLGTYEIISFFVQNTLLAFAPIPIFYAICLTIAMVIAVIKNKEGDLKSGIGVFIFDIFLLCMVFFLIKMPQNVWFDLFLFAALLISYTLLYELGGTAYAYVMKSLQFKKKRKKVFGIDLEKMDFRIKNQTWAFLKRDLKTIVRDSNLFYTYLLLTIPIVGLYTGIILTMDGLREILYNRIGTIFGIMAFLIPTFLGACELIGEYAVSKEGSFFPVLKALPIKKEKVVLIKYIQTWILGIPALLSLQMLLFVFPVSGISFLFYELFVLCYYMIFPFLIIEHDFHKPFLTWKSKKELFSGFFVMRGYIPMMGFPLISAVFFVLYEFTPILNETFFIGILFAIPILWGYFSYKRMKKNLKQWYQ